MILLLALAAAALALVVPMQNERSAVGLQPDRSGSPGTIGTAGSRDAELTGPSQGTLGSPIGAAGNLGGLENLSEQIGREVQLQVPIAQAINDVAFWTGSPPNQLLAVINRDTRSGLERQISDPSESEFDPPHQGIVTVRGVIEPIPYAEATYSWGLTRRDVQVLSERGVYLRIYDIVSEAPGQVPELGPTGVDEWNRETAPPPGEQVQTPAGLRPPAP